MTIALAIATRIRTRRRGIRLHPAIAGKHEISICRDHAGGDVYSLATCLCGWVSRVESGEIGDQDVAVDQHWRDVIAAAGGMAA